MAYFLNVSESLGSYMRHYYQKYIHDIHKVRRINFITDTESFQELDYIKHCYTSA